MEFKDRLSPNFNERSAGPIDMLILHYTGLSSAQESLDVMAERKVSAHYLVDEDGTIYRLVDEEKRAWHAGVSHWDGETDVNSRSVGIEIQNPGHENGYQAFPQKQMEAVLKLCQDILKRHPIPAHRILGHSDVAPGRKIDPGELFDWRYLAKNGVGVWPDPKNTEVENKTLDRLLIEYGYAPDVTPQARQDAFYRHFEPQSLEKPNIKLATARAAALIAAKQHRHS